MAPSPTPRPWRRLGVLALLIAVIFSSVALLDVWTPRLGLDLKGGTSITLTAQTPEGDAPSRESMEQAVEIIRQRVDGAGVAESEINTQGESNIVVSMPDVGQDELVALVGQTAELEFRPVRGIAQGGGTSDEVLPPLLPEEDEADDTEPPQTSELGPPSQEEQTALNGFSCDDITTGEPTDPDVALYTCDEAGAQRFLLGPVEVTGTEVSDATAVIPQGQLSWIVQLDLTSSGGEKFYESTQRLYGQAPPMNQFAIVLDGRVVSAPAIDNGPIPGGRAQISGSFDQQSAQALANVLKYGALPLTFETSDVSTITPTLGENQLQAGLLAGAIGLGLVLVYSLVYYRALGIVVMLSLAVAGSMTYGLILLLSEGIGFTLTIAGVAGIIVAIGVTADSFVVLFERIRDEIREGRSVRMAVETGWERARRTILTSDAVSLLAAFFLYTFSVANVRGFAFALGLTTLVDLVIVFLFTKPLVSVFARSRFFGGGNRWSGLDPERLGAPRRQGLAGRKGRTRTAAAAKADAADDIDDAADKEAVK